MKCPSCGSENQSGTYCASCGAALDATCSSCGADVPAGAAFCTSCGQPVAGQASGQGSKAPWVIAAASLAVVVVLVFVFLPGGTTTTAPPGAGAGPAPGQMPAGGTGGLSSDMRTNADRLFNRIMVAAQEGNQAEVDQFMPMAIQAYGMVEDLNNDGLYHLGMLHLTAGSYDQALATAQRILDEEPTHLMGLGVAAEAATRAGDNASAAEYWQRYLDAYDSEAGKPLPEYVDHQPMLPAYRSMAREALGQN